MGKPFTKKSRTSISTFYFFLSFQKYYLNVCNIIFYSDLSGIPQLKHIILESFSSASEEVKSAASYTLGNIACGNLQEYVPFILNEIEAQPKRQYLLLHSLKEVSNCKIQFIVRTLPDLLEISNYRHTLLK